MKMALHCCNHRLIFCNYGPTPPNCITNRTASFEQVNSHCIALSSDEGNINRHYCCTPPYNSIKVRITLVNNDSMGKIEFKTWNEIQYKQNHYHVHCKCFPYPKITHFCSSWWPTPLLCTQCMTARLLLKVFAMRDIADAIDSGFFPSGNF